ncbi:unnamed protein product [Mytilus coruscus]|uniref:Endonuclease/exonuclease/phosphatase domain-containing protein n=1 Tax=Mytilus coruscus TaxID=42192 RepID=A0A6J8DDP2_MYTCO|nr:unnamed protein product [Mytilus coruscus]
MVLSAAIQKLKNKKQFFVHEQYPIEIIERRRELVPILKDARTKGHEAVLKEDRLYIDKKRFYPRTSSQHPPPPVAMDHGCIYIPPEGSKYSNLEAFDEIENELMSFKKVSDVHTALIGDFNAKTGILNDFVLADETLLDLFHLDTDNEIISYMLDYENLKSYNIPLQRVTQCSCQPNTYGYKLLNCCKKMNMYIANSRIGVDKGVGKTTCKNTSVVDVLLLSSKLFTLVKEFEIQQFDPLLSDVHSAIHVTLKSQSVSHENNSVTSYQTSKTRWHDNKRNQFVNTVHNKKEQLSAILNDLHNLHSSDHCTQHEIDTVVDNIGEILVSSANETFVKNPRTTTQRTNKKPWYTKKCYDARKKFHKARKQYNLHKNEINHKKLLDFSKQYKQITNKAYNDYQFNLESKIRNTSKTNGREFWKILNNFNKKGNDDSNIISMESLAITQLDEKWFLVVGIQQFDVGKRCLTYFTDTVCSNMPKSYLCGTIRQLLKECLF